MIPKHKMDRICLMAAVMAADGNGLTAEVNAHDAITLYNEVERQLIQEVPDAVGHTDR